MILLSAFVIMIFLVQVSLGRTRPMYENPQLYSDQSNNHQAEAKWCLDNYGKKLNWTENETILDIGSGTGDVDANVLLPYADSKISSVVAIDMNQQFVDFCRNKWADKTKITFKMKDIGQPNAQETLGRFDKVFSFFALQWVQNQSTMGQNIFSLLKPGGQAFIVAVGFSGIYKVWDSISADMKWNSYLKNFPAKLNRYVYLDNPIDEFVNYFRTAGFKIEYSEQLERKNIFKANAKTRDEMKKKIRTVDPFIANLPENKKEDYLNDVLDLTLKMVSKDGATDYTAMIVIASKPKI